MGCSSPLFIPPQCNNPAGHTSNWAICITGGRHLLTEAPRSTLNERFVCPSYRMDLPIGSCPIQSTVRPITTRVLIATPFVADVVPALISAGRPLRSSVENPRHDLSNYRCWLMFGHGEVIQTCTLYWLLKRLITAHRRCRQNILELPRAADTMLHWWYSYTFHVP